MGVSEAWAGGLGGGRLARACGLGWSANGKSFVLGVSVLVLNVGKGASVFPLPKGCRKAEKSTNAIVSERV